MMVHLHSASHLKKKDSNTIVVFIIWMGKIPRLKIVRALETSLDVGEKDGCPGYATHEKQSWYCWIAGPSPRTTGFLQTQIIFAGRLITFQCALSIA